MITNFLKEQAALLVGSKMQYFAVGPGSQTLSSGLTTLTGSEFLRIPITGSPNFATPQEWTLQADINSVQASGLVFRQFGYFNTAGSNTGSAYSINQIIGSLVCDGTIELSFESTYKVI